MLFTYSSRPTIHVTAADITNAFADSYMQTSVELQVDPARRQAGGSINR